MQIEIQRADPTSVRTGALIVPVAQAERLPRSLAVLDEALGGAIERYSRSAHFDAKPASVAAFPASGIEARHVVLVGLGEERGLDTERLRRAAGAGVRAASKLRVERAALLVPSLRRPEPRSLAQALAEGARLGAYRFDKYRTDPERPPALELLLLLVSDARVAAAVRQGAERGRVIAECVALARDLANEPGSTATPALLADRAREVARQVGLRARVLAPPELERQQMGALLAVGRGAANPPRLIVLEHEPKAGAKGRRTRKGQRRIALVGKGITFDSGGISIKPAAGMDSMKGDMSGGAAVIATLRAAALLKLPLHVVGIVAAAQNMPDGNAYLPGDVLRSASGRTIEVLNTDAEGRLVLADALHYAQRYQPEAIIDIATLTGAKVVALGSHCCAVMGNDPALIRRIQDAGERTHERAWPLPLWDEHKREMKGEIADLKNAGGREAASSTAGAFLSHFVGDTPWAHLDIAGNELSGKESPYTPKGATGFGVRLLLETLQSGI
jgi:leucyl aminopeptidase